VETPVVVKSVRVLAPRHRPGETAPRRCSDWWSFKPALREVCSADRKEHNQASAVIAASQIFILRPE
jgi:hypothetical protein